MDTFQFLEMNWINLGMNSEETLLIITNAKEHLTLTHGQDHRLVLLKGQNANVVLNQRIFQWKA